MPKMELERFKQEAEEQLKDVTMDPAIQARILFRIREEEREKEKKKNPFFLRAGVTFGAAAAALVLLFATGLVPLPGRSPQGGAAVNGQANANHGQANQIAADTREIPQNEADIALKYGVYNLQDYHEGFAAAQNEKGLWGFVDEEYNWVVEPVYEAVSAVENGTASVKLNGKAERIPVKK